MSHEMVAFRAHGELLRRFLVFAALGFWIGGLTFYALVVIPAGQEVLRSHVNVGFITEKVTDRLNWIGVAALMILLWNVISAWKSPDSKTRQVLTGTWLLMIALQGTLFFLHPGLGRLLDHPAREVIDEPRFYGLHRVYLIVTTVQWAAAILHSLLAIAVWRRRDSVEAPRAKGAGS